MNKPRWLRMREASAGSSAPALERGSDADGDGDTDVPQGTSGDGDTDDRPCPDCDGSAIKDGQICPTCNGSGSVMAEAASTDAKVNCPTCSGKGKILGGNVTCPDCHGDGKVPANSPLLKESALAGDFRALSTAALASGAWLSDGSLREASVARLSEKDYSTDTRVQMAKDGRAIPIRNDKGEVTGGAYPINDSGDVKDALQAYGRSPTPQTKAHIVKRAKAVGSAEQVKSAQALGQTKETASLVERVASLEDSLKPERLLRESKPGVLNATYSTPTRVTTQGGKEGYQVVLIREGKGNAEDGNWYTGDAIREMCESGVAEGMQAYANHPDLEEEQNRPERDVKQLVGSYADVTFSESGGSPRAEAVFVPLTTDESHPTYGWVVTLAEAASSSTGPQPLCGISLYGLSAGDYGSRPDGSEGRVVTMIRPTSGDVVTNAGAGGGFIRKLMQESARRLRRGTQNNREDEPMQIGEFRTQMAEALKKLSEADSDEQRTEANAAIKLLEAEAVKIDAPPSAPDSIEALTEAAPALVTQLREAAKAEAATESDALKTQLADAQARLGEADKFITGITDVQGIAAALREAGVKDDTDVGRAEMRHFVQNAKILGLKEKADIVEMVETERAYRKSQEDAQIERLRESYDLPEVEGVFGRTPEPAPDGGEAFLRESGIPTKTPASA
jgi:hypothetical protein